MYDLANNKFISKFFFFYYNGEGTEKDLEKAFYWCQKAAEKDYIIVMYSLAVYYRYGEGTEKNFEKAFYWYQKAAEKDHIDAMHRSNDGISVIYQSPDNHLIIHI
ncbi:unnamed protein product [Rhizophagus irregularis]|nr:unnamed protein product [Rhizophagus irregularis]